jgi:hypothetical protein
MDRPTDLNAHNENAPIMDPVRSRQAVDRTVAQARIITDIAELEDLATLRVMAMNPSPVNLDIPLMSKEELNHWQSIINRQLSVCGCREGSLFLATSLGVFGTYLLLRPPGGPILSSWTKFGMGFSIAFIGATAGKLIGLLRARKLLKTTINQLRSEYGLKPT